MTRTDDVAETRPLWARLAQAFPRGGMLPDENWRRRHIALTLILLWHFPVVFGYGLYQGYPVAHCFVDAAAPLVFGAVAFLPHTRRGLRSMSVATGLISCSVVLVHLSHGLIEMHFHFFVMVALLTLYQDWKPFLVAIGLTVLEHGVTGIVSPKSVYNHPDAWSHPWRWAFIHGAFVVAASAASITAWSMAEADHRRHKADTARLHAERVAMLSHEAYHDMLTGLPNRRMVLDHLAAAASRARRNGQLLGVLFVDLDRFKHINDSYGHLIGDVVLRSTAERLRGAVRGGDLAGRLGGDEFVVVLEGLTDQAALDAAAQRVERAVVGAVRVDDGLTLHIAASVGRVLAREDDPWEELIARADLDMYRVKHLSRTETRTEGRIPTQR
jgi:diguanylate cyclase (GGDEF)-like protein